MKKYVDHSDTVTTVDPKRKYEVKAPTKHPIYEKFRVEVCTSICELLYFVDDITWMGLCT